MAIVEATSRTTWLLAVGVVWMVARHAHVIGASQYGDQCNPNDQLSCSSPNMTCSTWANCTCAPNYAPVYSDPKTPQCVQQVRHYSEVCTKGDFEPCIDTNTVCTDDVQGTIRCICGDLFYRNADNTCRSVQELGVTKVSATSTTNTVSLTWTADKHGMGVGYLVLGSQGQLENTVTDTGADWGNLTAGRKYNFSIITTIPGDTFNRLKQVLIEKRDVWTVPDKPGPVMVATLISGSPGQVYKYEITFQPSQGVVARYSFIINNEQGSGTATTYTFSTLYPGQNFSYAITAYNGIENPSEVSEGTVTLSTTYPGEVRNLTVTQDGVKALELTLTFLCPDVRNQAGNVQGYRIQKILLSSDGLQETNTSFRFPASKTSCTNSFRAKDVGGVMVERSYKFSVRAWNADFIGNYSPEVFFSVTPRAPILSPNYGDSKLLENAGNDGLERTEFKVQVCSHCFLDSSQGTVKDAGLVVCVQGEANACTETGFPQLSEISSWNSARSKDFTVPYRTTPSDWLTSLEAQPSDITYIIGHDSTCAVLTTSSYCNGPLPLDKSITVIVFQCNVAGCGQAWYPNIYSTKESPPENNILALGLGLRLGLGCLVLIGVIVVVVGCLKLRRRTPSPYNLPDPHYLDKHDYTGLEVPVPAPNPPPHRLKSGLSMGDYIDPIPQSDHPYKTRSMAVNDHDYSQAEEVIYDYISPEEVSANM